MSKKEKNYNDGLEYNQIPPKDIFTYNELRSCSDLFGLYKRGVLNIQPEFQRNEVWPVASQTRFIDSLLKELPIPSMCFSYDKESNEMKVIDGLQRMTSIIKFFDTENEWKLSSLPDIDPKISGKTNFQIKNEEDSIFENIKNLSLPVTFLRVNHSRADHNEYLFEIFHRLNTYGQKLNNQEIRNCIYGGTFNSLIKELDKYEIWKKLINIKNDNRFLKAELILRFFSFHDNYEKYDGFLTKFLNEYMSLHRKDKDADIIKKRKLFIDTVNLIFEKIADKEALEKKASNAFVETLFFGVSKNLAYLKKLDNEIVKGYYSKLINDDSLSEQNLSEATMRKSKVLHRLKRSMLIFSGK